MYAVKICNNSGKYKEWDVFPFSDQAQRERDLVIDEHDFDPDEVIIEKI